MASVAQTAIASTSTDGVTATFLAQAIGADGGSDIIYVLAGARSTANATTLAVTVDGVSATEIVFRSQDDGGGVRSNCGIYAIARDSLPDPAQTDVDIVLTHNQTCIRHAAALAVSAAASATAHDTDSAVAGDLSLSLDTPASGIVIGAIYNGDFVTVGWTGLTETSELNVAGESSNTFGTAYASNVSAETPRAVTLSFSAGDAAAKVAASFSEFALGITGTASHSLAPSSEASGVVPGSGSASHSLAPSSAASGTLVTTGTASCMEAAFIDLIKTDTAIDAVVSGRVYPARRPQGVAYPSIVATRISGSPGYADDGEIGLQQARMQVDSAAMSYTAAKDLAQLVRARLTAFAGVHYGITFSYVMLDEERDLPETGANAAEYPVRIAMDFIVVTRG